MRYLFSLLAFSLSFAQGATYTANLDLGQLRDAGGAIIADGGGVWAVIVSGTPGNPPASGNLPGGLTDGGSLTAANLAQIYEDFESVSLAAGQHDGFTIHQVGGFTSGLDLGSNGIASTAVVFDLYASPSSGFTAGTLWGLYWFPGKAVGETLSGAFEIGGFANSSPNLASGGEAGTTVQAASTTSTVSFFESGFNQTIRDGEPTGLDVSRFTAISVPEPSALAYSALASMSLLFRHRDRSALRGSIRVSLSHTNHHTL